MYTITNKNPQYKNFCQSEKIKHPIIDSCVVTGPGLWVKELGLNTKPLFIVQSNDILDIGAFAGQYLVPINKQIDMYADNYGVFVFKYLPAFSGLHKTDILIGPNGAFSDCPEDLFDQPESLKLEPSSQLLPDYAGIIALHTLFAPYIKPSREWLRELWYNSQALKENKQEFPDDWESDKILTKIALT
jgi:hypothetical protein